MIHPKTLYFIKFFVVLQSHSKNVSPGYITETTSFAIVPHFSATMLYKHSMAADNDLKRKLDYKANKYFLF